MNVIDMMYRVYVRWPNSTTTDKTTTEDGAVAELAFRNLMARPDLRGRDAGVALTADNRNVGFFNFATGQFELRGKACAVPVQIVV